MLNTDRLFLLLVAMMAALGLQAQEPPSAFAGSDACQMCHEDLFNAFAKNPHHAVETGTKYGFKGQACESCHGPAQKHTESAAAADIRNPMKMAAAAADKLCLTCHLNQPTQVGRLESSHMKDAVSCTSCHKIHANGPNGLVARKAADVNQLCASCHVGEWAKFQEPFHHRLPEGAMSCVDCHNPHGSTERPAMLQTFAANEPGCIKCHTDKRGPFTYEHPVVRYEGCNACHEPHGSANPRMLTRRDVRFVCLECHANLPNAVKTRTAMGVVPPAFHNLNLPVFQNCTVCHQTIHGSYVDRNLLR